MRFEIKDDYEKTWDYILPKVKEDFNNLLSGKWEVVFRKQTRTLPQNNLIHVIFSEIANTMAENGFENKIVIRARPTASNIKTYFKENILNGETSKATTKELAEALEVLMQSFNEFFLSKGVEVVRARGGGIENLLNNIDKKN